MHGEEESAVQEGRSDFGGLESRIGAELCTGMRFYKYRDECADMRRPNHATIWKSLSRTI